MNDSRWKGNKDGVTRMFSSSQAPACVQLQPSKYLLVLKNCMGCVGWGGGDVGYIGVMASGELCP